MVCVPIFGGDGHSRTVLETQSEKLYRSTNEKLLQLRENEMNAVRGALIEERHRLCLFVACLKPAMVS